MGVESNCEASRSCPRIIRSIWIFSFFPFSVMQMGEAILINTRDELIGSAVGGGRGESERCRRSRCRCIKKIVIRRADKSPRATTMRRNGLSSESFYSPDEHRQIFATVSKQFTTVNKSTWKKPSYFETKEGRKELSSNNR